MANYKKELIAEVCKALVSYGYDVYVSKSKEYGFYTDGNRVVSFGGYWNFCVDFSGNYFPSKYSGTGWQIAAEQGVPTKEEAERYIKANAPLWANKNPTYTTPEQHLKTYGCNSGYTLFNVEDV